MLRLQADAPAELWIPVTGSLGLRGRRHRRKAIGMLLAGANAATGAEQRGGGFTAWVASQAMPFLMRKADGRVLAWMWRADPEVVVVMAQVQEATPQLRTARAMMPMRFDDTVEFRNPHLGSGEKLLVDLPPDPATPPFATYTWDIGTHLVNLQAVGGDRERFGTVLEPVERIARTLRVVDDLPIDEAGEVLRLPPA